MGQKEKSDDKRYGFLFHIEVHVIRIQETPFYGLGFLSITVHVHARAHERKNDDFFQSSHIASDLTSTRYLKKTSKESEVSFVTRIYKKK